jgi:hypothetical protein
MPERHPGRRKLDRIELRKIGVAEDREDARWMSKH